MPNELLLEIPSDVTEATLDSIAQRYGLVRVSSLTVQLLGTTIYRWRITSGRSAAEIIRALAREGILRSLQANNLYLAGAQGSPADTSPANEDSARFAQSAEAARPQQLAQQSPAARSSAALSVKGEAAAAAAVRDLAKRSVETSIAQQEAPDGNEVQYALTKLRLPEAHRLALGENILIAVIDSGIDETHPDLANIVAGRFDAVGGVDQPHSHGTAVAGALVSRGKLRGAAPSARLLAVRAFEPAASGAVGTTFSIVKGLDWAATQGARVVNMSFAGPADPLLERAFIAVRRRGIVLVAAAGNGGPNAPPQYPAADPNVIAVTATDAEDKLFPAANRGKYVAVAAPGVDVLLPAPNARYQITSGTSIAAAHVSGIVALLIERRRSLNPVMIERTLVSTARDLGSRGRDEQFGAGLTDAYGAILTVEPAAVGSPAQTPAR